MDWPTPGRYHLHLFGRPRLTVADARIGLSGYQLALLGLLGGTDGALSRSGAIELLWSDGDEGTRRRRLSQLLYALSRRVGRALVETEGDELARNPDLLLTDLDRLEALLAEGHWAESVKLVQAGFLRDLPAPTGEYERWVDRRSGVLRRTLERRLGASWKELEEEGRWDVAATLAATGMELDPGSEVWLRRAVHSRAMAGDVERGLALYDRWRGGWDTVPDARTQELVERLRRSLEDGAGHPIPARSDEAVPGEPPFLGRRQELLSIHRALDAAGGAMRTIVVAGEAGAGKTRLVREALRRARNRGVAALMTEASEFESCIPLSPVAELLAGELPARHVSAVEEPWRTVLASLSPGGSPGGPDLLPPLDPSAVPRRLFESLSRLFERIADARGGLVLAVDDIQWADDTTIGALEFVRKRWSGRPGLLLVTARTEDLEEDSAPGRFIRALRAEEGHGRIQVGALEQEAARSLAEWFLGGDPANQAERTKLLHLAQGNPLFLVELARLRTAGGKVAGAETAEPALPDSLMGVLAGRLDVLTPLGRSLLEALAVRSKPTAPRILAAVLEESERQTLAGLDELEREHVVRWEAGEVAVRHPLLSRAMLEKMTSARTRWLHRRIGEVLRDHEGSELAGQLAVHFHQAGRGDEAREYAVLAADSAAEVGAYPEAAYFYGLALTLEADRERALRLRWRCAEMNFLAARYVAAGEQFGELAGIYEDRGSRSLALAARLKSLDLSIRRRVSLTPDLFRELKRIREGAVTERRWSMAGHALAIEIRALDAAGHLRRIRMLEPMLRECLREGDELVRARALPTAAVYELLFGDHSRALDLAREGVRLTRECGRTSEMAGAYNGALVVFIFKGLLNTEEGRALLGEVETTAREQGDFIYSRYSMLLNRGYWHLTCGDFGVAREIFQETRDRAASLDMDPATTGPRIWYNWATLSLAERELDEARTYLERYAESLDGSRTQERAIARACLGLCDLFQGDLRGAMDAASEAEPFLNSPALVSHDPLPIAELHARIAMIRNDHPRAIRILGEAAELCRDRRVPTWLWLKLLQARLAKRAGDDGWQTIGREPLEVARDLGLHTRARQLEALGVR